MPKRRHSTNTRLPKTLAVAGLALLIIAVLAFKDKPQTSEVNSSAGELAETQLWIERCKPDSPPWHSFTRTTASSALT